MIRFQWDEGMSVGVESIDQDHRRIIDIINQLSEAFEKGSGREVVVGLFDRLEEYASTHFAREERLMEEAGFPGLQEHAAQHKSFAGKIPELRDMLLEAASPSCFTRKDWRTRVRRNGRLSRGFPGFLVEKSLSANGLC
jgi:two-component system cell cycle response regulator